MKKIILGVLIVGVIGVIIFYNFFIHYEVEAISASVKESKDNLEITLDYSQSLDKCYSYSVSNDMSVVSIKVKVAPFIGDDWPKSIVIDEHPENIKSVQITDGVKTKVIYP